MIENILKLLEIFNKYPKITAGSIVGWTVLYFLSDLNTVFYFVILSFLLVVLFYNLAKKNIDTWQIKRGIKKKLHQLSVTEKAIIKCFIDKDRRTLEFESSHEDIKRLKDDKKIIENKDNFVAIVSGNNIQSNNMSNFTIKDIYFEVAKQNFKDIFGEH